MQNELKLISVYVGDSLMDVHTTVMPHSTVQIDCPNCSHRFAVSISELLPGNSKKCSGCGRHVEFSADDIGRGVRRAMDDMGGNQPGSDDAADTGDGRG